MQWPPWLCNLIYLYCSIVCVVKISTCKINSNDKFIKLLSHLGSKPQCRTLVDISTLIYVISCTIRWCIVIPLPVIAPHPWFWWITLKWTLPTIICQCHPSWDKDGSEDKSNRILKLFPKSLGHFLKGETHLVRLTFSTRFHSTIDIMSICNWHRSTVKAKVYICSCIKFCMMLNCYVSPYGLPYGECI